MMDFLANNPSEQRGHRLTSFPLRLVLASGAYPTIYPILLTHTRARGNECRCFSDPLTAAVVRVIVSISQIG